MEMAGKVAEGLVHERNRPSSSDRWTKAEYGVSPFLVHAPCVALRELVWGWFDLSLGHKGFKSRELVTTQ